MLDVIFHEIIRPIIVLILGGFAFVLTIALACLLLGALTFLVFCEPREPERDFSIDVRVRKAKLSNLN